MTLTPTTTADTAGRHALTLSQGEGVPIGFRFQVRCVLIVIVFTVVRRWAMGVRVCARVRVCVRVLVTGR